MTMNDDHTNIGTCVYIIRTLRRPVGTLTVHPFPGNRTDDAKQLIVGDRFGFYVVEMRFQFHIRISPVQRFPYFGLARAGQTDNENRMSDF